MSERYRKRATTRLEIPVIVDEQALRLTQEQREDSLTIRLVLGSSIWLLASLLLVQTARYWAAGAAGQIVGTFLVFGSFLLLYVLFGTPEISPRVEVAGLFAFLGLRFVAGWAASDGLIGAVLLPLTWAIAAFFLGRLVAHRVAQASYLVPVAVVASIADVWSIVAGPSRALLESRIAAQFTVGAPAIAAGGGAGAAFGSIGVSDLVFLAFFLAVGRRFSLPQGRTVMALAVALAVCAAVVNLVDLPGIPALPFLCAAFIAAHWTRTRPGRREVKLTLGFAGILVLIMTSVSLLVR